MKITIGKGSCGIAAGVNEVSRIFAEAGIEATVTGCIGKCYLEPIVNINDDIYVKVDSKGADELVKLIRGEPNQADTYKIPAQDLEILKSQTGIALKNCGLINPESIDEYIEKGGYTPHNMSPEEVIDQIKISGLCGRGGAGFPTWFKWKAARDSAGSEKYIICNADEGDPGAFMDRAILEGDPHAVLEGMMIAAYAIGAGEGIIYVRAEYPLAIKRLEIAIAQAREKKLLGAEKGFDIRIKAGAGAFVCGEETALIASLEGERGMPRLKPPFPAQKGYNDKPSNINNVETFANVPWIIKNGGSAFSAMGTENSKGTKVFALTGKINKGGLVEVPMGGTVKDVIYGAGGGIKDGKKFKAVQMGGPSGGCIPAELENTEIDYESLKATGAIMGSGGMVVMDETTCMVDMARYFLDFTCKESCGKCTHCRVGNRRLLEILERICEGNGKDGDIELLSELSEEIKAGSLCALGQTAPNPVLTTLKYFENEYIDHIVNKKCTAKSCKAFLNYQINMDKCKKCNLCAKKCPVGAITDLKIDSEKCTKCGLCASVCRLSAIDT
ncbi:MAG: 4Fe-4S binding protein [Lachnospiraceae bacterium]|nr:4Fe-4S binding protein [Lachnospiraceae bacterium]